MQRAGAPYDPPVTQNPAQKIRQKPLAVDPTRGLPIVTVKSLTWYPLLYRKRLQRVDPKAGPGDLVAVYGPPAEGASGETLLGYGIYNPRSEIAVRILRHGQDLPGEEFWGERLAEAVQLRRDLLRLDVVTDAYRVVHAEADGLSGLVVDRFGDVLSAEAFSLGMFQRAGALLERLGERLGTRTYRISGSPQFLAHEGVEPLDLESAGCPDRVTISEFGTRFRVKFSGGHKTGFFCDQRDNRRMLASYCEGRSVLDLCCYTGGFAVQAKVLGKAAEVTAVDLDEAPLAIARENANLNQVRLNLVQADAFVYMRDRLQHGHRYDVVVLDPPKLIRNRAELEEGTRKHFDLNKLAMQLVKPGGLLLTCSCAGLLEEAEFLKLLHAAARQAGPELPELTAAGKPRHAPREVQVLARTGAAPDHPVSWNVPETEYLKAVWLRMI